MTRVVDEADVKDPEANEGALFIAITMVSRRYMRDFLKFREQLPELQASLQAAGAGLSGGAMNGAHGAKHQVKN